MKPSFALVLTQDTIALLHRTSQGWQPVGEAEVADPELTNALGFLRRSALELDPSGLSTKLVIPASEILYTTVHAPGPSASARRSQIRAALEGHTPYAVRDLVFDWTGSGPEVQVAVVARETLQEAEGFASQHRLGPLSFVGSPGAGQFDGEPWFGPAAAAQSLLAPGEKVERDQMPVPALAARAAETGPEPERDAPAMERAEEAIAPAATGTGPASLSPAVTEPAASGTDLSLRPAEPAAAPPPEPPAPALPQPTAAPLPEPVAARDAVPHQAAATMPNADVAAATGTQTWGSPNRDNTGEKVALARADAAPLPLARSVRAEVIAPGLDVPPEAPPEGAMTRTDAGSSAPAVDRLKARLAEQPVDPRRFGTGPTQAPTVSDPAVGNVGAIASRPAKPAPVSAPIAAPSRVGPVGVRPAAARVGGKPALRGGSAMVTSPGISMPRDRRVNIPGAAEAAEARAKAAAEARKTAKAEAERLTGSAAKPVARGKPRYLGMILTGLLLVLLAAIAAWSSFLASDNPPDAVPVVAAPAADSQAANVPAPEGPEPEAVAATAADQVANPTVAAQPAQEDVEPVSSPPANPAYATPSGDLSAASGTTDLVPAGSSPAVELSKPDLAAEVALSVATAGNPVAAAPSDADTPVIPPPDVTAQVGRSPQDTPQDEIFLTITDPVVPTADPVALAPPLPPADTAPEPQPLPPPFGTVYQFDAAGRIVPTPEGIVTPEGVRLVLGKPARTPSARPSALAPPSGQTATTEAAPPGTVPNTEATAASVSGVIATPVDPAAEAPLPAADPALAGARPRSRPADLLPALGDDAALPPAADTQVTTLRPRLRPAALVVAAEAESAAAEAAAIQSASASLAATATEAREISPLAVAVSRKPAPRPRDFSKAVEAAVAAIAQEPVATAPEAPAPEPVIAMAAPEPRPTVSPGAIPQQAPAKPAPAAKPAAAAKPKAEPPEDEIDEPEVASAAPDLPTRANVAKQATFRNAINLSKINLIGVYGSASNRHALVRQPNGRYVKVEVGDRVDGGKVAAISERELRYVKNGRTVTLALPKG